MKIIHVILAAMLLLPAQSLAGVVDDLKKGDGQAASANSFCRPDESPEACNKRFDAIFHEAYRNHEGLFNECMKRASRVFPKDLMNKFQGGPVKLPDGRTIGLHDALSMLAQENGVFTAACIMGLMHDVADDMGRKLGVPVPEQEHLARFDAKLKENRP